MEKWVYFLMCGDQLTFEEATQLNPSIKNAHKTLQDIQNDQLVLQAIHKREKDALMEKIEVRREFLVEQIEEFATEAGLEVPGDLKHDLMQKDEEKLKAFVRRLIKENWDRDVLRYEIEGLRR